MVTVVVFESVEDGFLLFYFDPVLFMFLFIDFGLLMVVLWWELMVIGFWYDINGGWWWRDVVILVVIVLEKMFWMDLYKWLRDGNGRDYESKVKMVWYDSDIVYEWKWWWVFMMYLWMVV
jgi:hypothetical protein